MSTAGELRKSRFAAAGFVALLALSVFWPSPIVSSNQLWFQNDLAVDELSFLGREALHWDVVYWCLAGIFALMVVQSGGAFDVSPLRRMRYLHFELPPHFLSAVIAGTIVVALVWLFVDSPGIAFAEWIQSETTRDVIRIFNRLGGGWNPVMMVLFFLIAGIAYGRSPWVGYAVAMAVAGLGAGLIAQILKLLFARTRPEMWLGPFHFARTGANSFPSGHTVGVFALAGVLLFASRSMPLRVAAMVLASAVAISRVMAFRHWPSDVVASAGIGLMAASIAVASVTRVTSGSGETTYSAARE